MNDRDGRRWNIASARPGGRATALAAALVAALVVSAMYLTEPLRSCVLVALSLAIGGLMSRYVRGDFGTSAATPPRPAANDYQSLRSPQTISLRDVPNAVADPAIVLDPASVVVAFNAGARALFDRLRTGAALEHVLRDPELIDATARALSHGERRSARLARRGERRLTATVAPLGRDGDGAQPPAVLITIHDQSEQHRLLEMRSDFIANASHELRTPLASVRGFIETLQSSARNDPAARERFLAIMAEQAERMTRLIDDLLLLSRVEEKANLKPTGKVDVRELISEVARSLETQTRDQDFSIVLVPGDAVTISPADHDELFQVFHNVMENAVKYGRESGTVTIGIERISGAARIKIADNGPGISPEHLPRLTERFYRVNAEHSRRIGGTGLGLAIVKHVLNRHGGELNVHSVLGQGTTFEITLPGVLA